VLILLIFAVFWSVIELIEFFKPSNIMSAKSLLALNIHGWCYRRSNESYYGKTHTQSFISFSSTITRWWL